MKKIGIFIANSEKNWGPGKLAHNTIKGFDLLNIPYAINEYGDYNLCICGDKFKRYFIDEKVPNAVIGPCCMNLPTENIESFSMYETFLVASKWYMDNWKTYGVNNVKYWFGGIDTDYFTDCKNESAGCFIYYKNREYDELERIINILSRLHIECKIINYGNYTESEFININNKSKFGIILSNTETQGFAIMECMSMNTPLFVLDKNNWMELYFGATSVPYFSEKCGMVIPESDIKNKQLLEERFVTFISNLERYNPREFILDGYKITDSISLLLEIMNYKK